MQQEHYYQTILKRELNLKSQVNPHYSLRAFARHLDISPSALSEIISGKRKVSISRAMKLLEKLDIDDKKEFIESVKATKKSFQKINYDQLNFKQLSLESFEIISDWYYFAILNLAKVKNSKFDANWIAHQLGISMSQSQSALQRLEQMQLIENDQGNMKRTKNNVKLSDDVPSSAIKKYHSQILQKAQHSLFDHDVHERDITTLTLALSKKNLDKAKKKIKEFRSEMRTLLETDEPDSVYKMNVSLFPVSLGEEIKNESEVWQ